MPHRQTGFDPQQGTFRQAAASTLRQVLAQSHPTTFVNNMKLPVHRWFRYSAGYSGRWAADTISMHRQRWGDGARVLDPFAGSGTTLLAADEAGVLSHGFEAQPFVHRVCGAKLAWDQDPAEFATAAQVTLRHAREHPSTQAPNALVAKCFAPDTSERLFRLKQAIDHAPAGDAIRELLWLALVSIARRCSHAGTAPWQYVLPNRIKANVAEDPFLEFERQTGMMAADMREVRRRGFVRGSNVELLDSRAAAGSRERGFSLVLTSPPYANNYDYGDATRVELSILGEVQTWGDLKEYRRDLLPSCTQHVSSLRLSLSSLLGDDLVEPISADIEAACRELEATKELKGGKKQYDLMVAAYFVGMARHWEQLSRLMLPGAELCYVVGDSAPYGVHVPTEEWLARLASPHGFELVRFEKVRDRNTKWKNRKHTVPLKEGNLWLTFKG